MKKATTVNSLPEYTEERLFSFHNEPLSCSQAYKTFTLKGRLEYRKDYKTVLYAASQTPGIVALRFDGFAVEITWLSVGAGSDGEETNYWEDAKRHIATFVKLVKEAPTQKCFDELGLETHVFWESLKPITQYNGERDGFWARR
jgi:hypothetical protein